MRVLSWIVSAAAASATVEQTRPPLDNERDCSWRIAMSATMPTMQSVGEKSYEDVRKGWHDAHVRPLWESTVAHRANEGGPKAHLWQWAQLRGFIDEAMKVTTPAAVERRVLSLVEPGTTNPAAGTTTNLSTALQVLLPGESARPHRHTMNAIRFVI